LDDTTKKVKWSFIDTTIVPKTIDEAKEIIQNAIQYDTPEAMNHIIYSIKADVVVPHMFCYPG